MKRSARELSRADNPAMVAKSWIVAIGCTLAGFCAGAFVFEEKESAAAAGKEPMVVVAAGDARFAPIDPAHPDAAQLAVLWGDPTRRSSDMFLRFKRGQGTLHVHSSDYHLVVLRGTMKHRAAGQNDADVEPLEPGSYWFQPGNQPHADSCLSDECLMFIHWEGKRDSRRVEAPATR